MKQILQRALPALLLSACISSFGQSNPIEGGATETVTNQWTVTMPWLMVGSNTDSNTLEVTAGGTVNSTIGILGHTTNSAHNTAEISGEGSTWNSSMELSVGNLGGTNSLIISAGGTVSTPEAYIGSNSDGNLAVIDGEDSLLGASTLHVGSQGENNSLLVTGNGRTSSDTGTIGYWIESDGNTATVQSNGIWSSTTKINVGKYGSANTLAVDSDGLVDTPVLNVGAQTVSDGNTVSVSGNGATLNAPAIFIGGSAAGAGGSNNLVEVQNGGTIHADALTIYSDNRFDLNDGGKLAISTNFNASMNGFNFNSGGTLEVGGDLTGMNTSIDQQRTLILNGSSAAWNISNTNLTVGETTGKNALIITNGSLVNNRSGYIGFESGASSNSVLITGNGSVWKNSDSLYLGGQTSGTGNSLTVENDGWVLVGNLETNQLSGFRPGIVVGDATGTAQITAANGSHVNADRLFIGAGVQDSGQVLITGTGTVWNSGSIGVGEYGSNNRLIISDGAQLNNTVSASISGFDGSTNNAVVVTGNNAEWTIGSTLYMGFGSGSNSLSVLDGGHLSADTVHVLSSGNELLVSGTGSQLNTSNDFRLGHVGSNNRMWVEDGGTVSSSNSTIGYHSGADINKAVVSGNMSTWDTDGKLHVGYGGANNSLLVTDMGHVYGWDGITVGHNGTATGNTLTVSGNGSFLNTGAPLMLARTETGLILPQPSPETPSLPEWLIEYLNSEESSSPEGGTGSQPSPLLGSGFSTNVIATFPQPTAYDLYGKLTIGDAGSNNKLTILDGGRVASGTGIIGAQSGADSNRVVVAGTGSTWSLWGNLYLGGSIQNGSWANGGRNNALLLGDGGLVSVNDDLHNRNHSTISLDPDSLIAVNGNYYQDDTSLLRFGVETNAAGAPLTARVTVDGTAEFDEHAQLIYASNVGELQFDTVYTNKLIEAGTLVVAGITNANSLDLEKLDASGSLVDVIFWEDDQNIYALANRRYLTESAGFTEGSMLDRLAQEIDDMSLLGDSNAVNTVNILNNVSGDQQYTETAHQFEAGAPTFLHIQGMTEGLRELTGNARRTPSTPPAGTNELPRTASGLRGWTRHYGSWAEHDTADSFNSYGHDIHGTITGVEWTRESLLFGIAGGSGLSTIEMDNGDRSKTQTDFGAAYASLRSNKWFADMILAFGAGTAQDRSSSIYANRASYDTANSALYLGLGREIRFRDGLIVLTPEASAKLSHYRQENYTETGLMPRDFDAYERYSAVSGLGASIALQKQFEAVALRSELHARWLHEFNASRDTIHYSLVNGTDDYHIDMPAPTEDLLETGAGLSCIFSDRLSLGIMLDWTVGDNYDACAAGGRLMLLF